MAVSVKISDLLFGGNVQSQDVMPIARAGETYKINAQQFVVNSASVGDGSQITTNSTTGNGTTLKFRSLKGEDGIEVRQESNTLVITASGQQPVKNKFYGDGSETNFEIVGAASTNSGNYRVDIDGVLQEPGTDYNISLGDPTYISFTSAPPLSSKVVVISNNLVRAVDLNLAPVDTNTIDLTLNNSNLLADVKNSSISAQHIAVGAVTTSALVDNSVTTQTIANSAITAEKMSGGQTGSAPVYGCRAWVNFNGTRNEADNSVSTNGANVKINRKENVTRVLKNGPGDYTVTFTTFMPDINFCVLTNVTNDNVSARNSYEVGTYSQYRSLSTVRVAVVNSGNTAATDSQGVCVAVFC